MSMKRCFELPAGPSFSAISRAVLIGGVLSLAVACARKDASKGDSTAAVSDSATKTASAMTAPSATPMASSGTEAPLAEHRPPARREQRSVTPT